MQLTQSTGRAYGYNRDINEQNIKGGMAVLKAAYDKCGATNFACLSANYNGSPRPGEQAGWANGVQKADQELKGNPQLLASACAGGSDAAQCEIGPGGFDPGPPNVAAATAPGKATITLANDITPPGA